jgi:hypothetical protein
MRFGRNIFESKMKKYLKYIILMIFVIVVILPALIYGYVYPNTSDDTAHHLQFIDSIKNENSSANVLYYGRYIIGYPIIWLNELTGISINWLFFWFNYAILILSGLVCFYVVYKLTNWQNGLLSMLFLIFVVPSVLGLFGSGAIFDLITLSIFMPLFIYCGIKSLFSKKWYFIVSAIILFVFCLGFHSISIVNNIGVKPEQNYETVNCGWFILGILGIFNGLFIIGALWKCLIYRKNIQYSKELKLALIGLVLLSVILIIGTFTKITPFSYRFALELSFVLGFIGVLLFGNSMQVGKGSLVTIFMVIIVIVGSLLSLRGYYSYNSAVTLADKEAFEYINSLQGDYFSCSPEVAPWIYERFINKKYQEGAYPYIDRNIPMTWATNHNDKLYYWWADKPRPEMNIYNPYIITYKDVVIEVRHE